MEVRSDSQPMSDIHICPEKALPDSKTRQHKFGIPLWVCVATCTAVAAVYWVPARKPASSLARSGVSPNREALLARTAEMGDRRPVYRHSVIVGGAYSVAEVGRARQTDPVVDAHYAVFNPTQLRMTVAPASRAVYVSYRIGSHIYWAKNRVRLEAGETLITDGEHLARARCGNRVANTPQQPVGAEELPAGDLDLVELPVSSYVPLETDLLRPSALLGDLFPPAPFGQTAPPAPLGQILQYGSAAPGSSFLPFPSLPGSGMGSGGGIWTAAPGSATGSGGGTGTSAPGNGTGSGAVSPAPAPTFPGATAPPVNGLTNGPSGSAPLAGTQPGVVVYSQWFPFPTGFPGTSSENQNVNFGIPVPPWQSPIAAVGGAIPPPVMWFPGGTPILQNSSGNSGNSGGQPETGQVVVVETPPPNTAYSVSPEPGTAMLLAIGMALVAIRESRRQQP